MPWFTFPQQRAPFGAPIQLTDAQRDSILEVMAFNLAEAAANRAPTEAERDAAAKEAMLKMRLTGRTLLVPPDNTGGLISSRISLPLFSAGPTKAARQRTQQAMDENRARLDRLRQRADSLRRARADSLP